MSRAGPLLLLVLAAAVYVPSLGGGYVYDDPRLVSMNPSVTEGASLLDYFTDPSTQTGDASWGGNYRPVRTLSFRVVSMAGGGSTAHRVVNLLLHLVNGLLVWRLLRLLLPGGPGPLLGAAAFLLHPLATESVAFISSRGDLLAVTGVLGALLLHLAGRRLAALAVFLAALMSKESAVFLPLALVVTDGYQGGLARVRDRLPAYAAFAGVLAVFLVARFLVLDVEGFGQEGGRGLPRWMLLSWLPVARVYYVVKMLVPVGLSFEWRMIVEAEPAPPGLVASCTVLLALLLVLAFRSRRDAKPVTLAILWFLVALSPVVATQLLVPLKILVANRFVYPALPAFALLLAFVSARGRAAVVCAVVVLFCFVPLTVARADVWRSPERLWSSVLEHDPRNPVALFGLGTAAANAEDWEKAADLLHRAALESRGPATPKLAAFLGEAHAQLAAREELGSPGFVRRNREALSAYRMAVLAWKRGATIDRHLYRTVVVDTAWAALFAGGPARAREYGHLFLTEAGPVPANRRITHRLEGLAAAFAQAGDAGLARRLAEAASALRGGDTK